MNKELIDSLQVWASASLYKKRVGRGPASKEVNYGLNRLRELVYNLGITGELTQNLEREGAKALYKKILTTQKELVVSEKLKKVNLLSEVAKDESLFSSPKEWEWIRLGTLGTIFNGNSVSARLKKEKYEKVKEGVPYIGTKDVGYSFEELKYNNGIRIPDDEPRFKVASKGAVLICSEGGSAGKKCGITNENICFGNKLFAIEPYCGVLPEFILIYYSSPIFKRAFFSKMTGIIGGISSSNFKELPCPLPTIEEQSKIVSRVQELLQWIDDLEKEFSAKGIIQEDLTESLLEFITSEKSKSDKSVEWEIYKNSFLKIFNKVSSVISLKNTILNLSIRGRLRSEVSFEVSGTSLLSICKKEKAKLIEQKIIKKPKKLPEITSEEIPYDLPEGWAWSRLQDVTALITDGKHGDCNNEEESGYYFLSAKDIQGGKLLYSDAREIVKSEFEEVHQRTNLCPGDICLVNTGATVGKLAIVKDIPETRKTTFQKSVAVIKALDPHINNLYIANFLKAETANLLNKSGGSAINNLLLTDLKMKLIPIPPREVQDEICTHVEQFMTLIDNLLIEINSLEDIRKLMSDAALLD